jgi:hypothetical protein
MIQNAKIIEWEVLRYLTVVGTPMIAAGISKKLNRFIKLDSLPESTNEIKLLITMMDSMFVPKRIDLMA